MLSKQQKNEYKDIFLKKLKIFSSELSARISHDDEWDIRGFIDIFKNIYTISNDTKIVSKVLELHLFPYFLAFAKENNYRLELTKEQNYYPDMSFVHKEYSEIKFAIDLKSTYILEKDSTKCNGFTLGSHGKYFKDRTSTKNIMYPYGSYLSHIILGIIYTKASLPDDIEIKKYTVNEIRKIPAVVKNFIFFAEEKWKIASDKSGSGNTANIGSIKCIKDILTGNGVFAKGGESLFDEYWTAFGEISIPWKDNKKLSCLEDYLAFRNLPMSLYNETENKKIQSSSQKLINEYLKKEENIEQVSI